jgi:hypothetical protein
VQPKDAFSSDYAQARAKFLHAAKEAGLAVTAYPHPQVGRDGELLSLDVVLDGPPSATRLLIVSSACHGVEGFCGSGVQVHALHDIALRAHCAAKGVAVLYLHAINPFGFSHLRRATHENVDLNRNFQDFSEPLPLRPAYSELHPLLMPDCWPPDEVNVSAMARYMAVHGMSRLQEAITGGQYQYPDGLFYGGLAPTWSNHTLRTVLRQHAGHASSVAWIDLHTGLGPCGHGERAFAGSSHDSSALARAQKWWSGNGKTPLVSLDDGTSVSAPLVGLMWSALGDECPKAIGTAIAIEFGTQPLMQVLQALRAEQWLTLHPDAPLEQAKQIKHDMLDAFYVDTADWKERVISQAREAMVQAVDGLSSGN